MKKCFKGFVQLAVALTFISSAYADKAAVTKAMAKSMPSMKVDSIKPAAVKGLFEVVAGTTIYTFQKMANIYYKDDWLILLLIKINRRKAKWRTKTGY